MFSGHFYSSLIFLFIGVSLTAKDFIPLKINKDEVSIYLEIDPDWFENSITQLENSRGISDKIRSKATALIRQENKSTSHYAGSLISNQLTELGVVNYVVSNPFMSDSSEREAIVILRFGIETLSEDFPYYYKGFIKRNIQTFWELEVYLPNGALIGNERIVSVVDYKANVLPKIVSRSKFEIDIESLYLISRESLNVASEKLISSIKTGLDSIDASDVGNLSKDLKLEFQKRRLRLPNYYTDFETNLFKANDRPMITDRSIESKNAAFNDVGIANQIAEHIGDVDYHALVIGINDYSDPQMNDLDNPISDAESLIQTLTKGYTFSHENITFLKNPTRNEIIQTLDNLANTITEQSNFLIFYAGHGYWDVQLEKGYWLPRDAAVESRANWLSNSDMVDYVRGIRSRHTLLIADACFSGSIFKTRDAFAGVDKAIYELYKYPSKKAMTSGSMKTVPDKSVFVKYLIQRLTDNDEGFLSAEELFASFKQAVINNSPNSQVPQFGEIHGAGDEGGDFIFVRSRN